MVVALTLFTSAKGKLQHEFVVDGFMTRNNDYVINIVLSGH